MLDFLGLTDEANRLLTCAVIAGFVGMIPGGPALAGKNINKFVSGLCIGICCVAVLFGLWPAAALFLMLQWGALFKALFFALIAGAVSGIPGFLVVERKRRKVYRNNPVMREVVAYCNANNIVGIQCYPDRLRFFTGLDSTEYCKSDNYVIHEKQYASTSYTSRIKTWSPTDNDRYLQGTLYFAERKYPNLPDVGIFASVLAKSLGGCQVVTHRESTERDYTRYDKSTDRKELVHHTTITYEDHFVFKTSALKALKQHRSQQEQQVAQRRADAQKNTNRWE